MCAWYVIHSLAAIGTNFGGSNTVVFNLWAACIQGWGNQNQSLSFSDWTYPCSGNGSTVTYKDYPLHEDAQGVDIPSWAYLNITKEDTFDIFGALNGEY